MNEEAIVDYGTACGMIPRPAPFCVIRMQKEGYLFYNSRTDELHLMPPTAYRVYQLCDGVRTAAEIAEWLIDALPDDPNEVRGAVDRFLNELITRGILEAENYVES